MDKIRITFVCFGNICRSPMAEFLMKELVQDKGTADKFEIDSAATNGCETGSPVHYGTARILERTGIDFSSKRARKLNASDYGKSDYFIGMDAMNIRDMKRLLNGDPEGKVRLLLDFTDDKRDVADPWYTGNFEQTFKDVTRGINGFYEYLEKEGKV